MIIIVIPMKIHRGLQLRDTLRMNYRLTQKIPPRTNQVIIIKRNIIYLMHSYKILFTVNLI